ncbi:Myosin-6 [Camellia lanceoleosa]|uniref:Myosin-6 n=1 Tax=Camellia lanceoleosa TaxID=1840588 RepID=A0ACC0FSE5_9ERIC|nr:Myosin-6 [Camellia lanceoleosa]
MDRGVCIAALLLLNYTDFALSGWGFAGCNSLWTGESVYHAAVVFCLQGQLAREVYENIRREASCLRIQRDFRMHLARKAYKELCSSAVSIQAGMRGMVARDEHRFRRQIAFYGKLSLLYSLRLLDYMNCAFGCKRKTRRFSMEEVFNNNNNSTTKTSNREVNVEIMVIDDGEEPSKSESESETINKVEELSTPRIPRVPPLMRNHENNKGMFDPKVVSIGPYHHGKEDLQLVENVKPMACSALGYNLGVVPCHSMVVLLYRVVLLSSGVCKVEPYYAVLLFFHLSSFLSVLVLLGLVPLQTIPPPFFDDKVIVSETDRESFHLLQLARTKYLNLNQSLYILESQVSTKKEKDKFQCKQHLKDYIQHLFCYFKEKSLKIHGFVKKHKYSQPKSDVMEYFLRFGSATKLKAKGIHFRPNRSLSLEVIEFKSWCFYGRLELHPFLVDPPYKLFMSNMIAYEMVSCTSIADLVITSYIDFMQLLIDNQDDVKELRSKHILFNALGSDQEGANVFKEITIFGTYVILYDDIKQRIQVHYNSTAKT